MSKKVQSRHKALDPNFLPSHIGDSFLSELDVLVKLLKDRDGFKGEYLFREYRDKYVDSTTLPADVRRQAAIDKWLSTEERNRTTNRRLYLGGEDFGWSTSDSLLEKAQLIIRKILGPFDPSLVFVGGVHTNGASTRVRRSPIAAIQKHEGKAHGTLKALYLYCLAHSGTKLAEQDLEETAGSVMFTVPKTAEIDRVACKEPEINMFLQREVGSFIRRRLLKVGVNLNDQTVNQRLARDALHEGLATIDLSAASDSISRQLVFNLLPFDWWSVLEDIRVTQTLIGDEWHNLEMFSSMGNGFTFELESLIFYALTRAVCWESGVKGRVSVYGDDIIAPRKIAPRLARIFAYFGFKVNTKKSHWSGLFRESCGKHYYNGWEVTPFYVREPIRRKTDIIRLLNRLLVWDSMPLKCICTPEVYEFHKKWSAHIPDKLHGGIDPESIQALVTGDRPRWSILPRKKDMTSFSEDAALTYWLTAAQVALRTTDPLVVDPSRETGRFRLARVSRDIGRTSWDPYLIFGPNSCGDSG